MKSASTDAKAKMSAEELRGQLTVRLLVFLKVCAHRRVSRAYILSFPQTFLLAGHETTSTSLTWTLWTLSRYPEVQTKLRAEIRDARKKAKDNGTDEIESDDLNALPYLDAVTVSFYTERLLSSRRF